MRLQQCIIVLRDAFTSLFMIGIGNFVIFEDSILGYRCRDRRIRTKHAIAYKL